MEALESVIKGREADNDSFDWMDRFSSIVRQELHKSYVVNGIASENREEQDYYQSVMNHLTDGAMKLFYEHEEEIAHLLIDDTNEVRTALKSPIYQQQLCLADTPLRVVRVYLSRPRSESSMSEPYYAHARRQLQRHIYNALMTYFQK